MGADFLFAITPMPGRDALEDRFDKLSRTQLFLGAERGGFHEPIMNAAAETRIEQYFHEALNYLLSDARDYCTAKIGGDVYVATGGMSWGDAPTDAWDYIVFIEGVLSE